MFVDRFHPENSKLRKNKAIIQVWMMAPKASGVAVLGRHHPPVCPPYGNGNKSHDNWVYDLGSSILRENPIAYDNEAKLKPSPSN